MLEILSLILLGLVVLFMVSIFNKNFTTSQRRLPPGPLRLPILGNLLQVAWLNPKEPYLAFSKLGQVYGDIVSIQLGSLYSVVFNSFDVMEEYLSKPEFSDRHFNKWWAEKSFGKRLGIGLSKYPSPCIPLRRFSLRSLREYGFGKKNQMQPIIHAELSDLVCELQCSTKENNGIQNFDNFFNISVLNIVWSMLAGKRFEHDDPKLLKLINLVDEFAHSFNVGNGFLIAFPEWKDWFPDWTGMSVQRKCYREMNAFFQAFVEERKALGAYKTSPENLVDEFLHEIDAAGRKPATDGEIIFTEQQLVALMVDFFFAGAETTSSTLSYCVLYLILNPEVQQKLQKEIDLVVLKGMLPDAGIEPKPNKFLGKLKSATRRLTQFQVEIRMILESQIVTFEISPALHYVKATLAETHRMGSVLPMAIPHATTTNTLCGKFFVPKGTYVIPNVYGMHHDKIYWKDPENFRPERFLDENGMYKGDPRLKPFGFGKRICIGEPVASMNLIHYLTHLMQMFTFRPVPNETLPSTSPVIGIANAPKKFRALVEIRE